LVLRNDEKGEPRPWKEKNKLWALGKKGGPKKAWARDLSKG